MKLLLDMPLSQHMVLPLRADGHDAIHAGDIGLAQEADEELMLAAQRDGRLLVTMDLDFPRLLSSLSAEGPGVIVVRLRYPTPEFVYERLTALFRAVPDQAILAHAIVVVEELRFRLHHLPL